MPDAAARRLRSHPRPGRRAAGADHVRRLPVPVLHGRAVDRRARAQAARRAAALRVPPPAAARGPSRRAARRRGRPRRPPRRAQFWEMHDALYANGGQLRRRRPGRGGAAVGTGRRALPRRADRRDVHARGSRATPTARVRPGSPRRRRSSSTAATTPSAFDAGSLVEALKPDRLTSVSRGSDYPSPPMLRFPALLSLVLALFVAACGGGNKEAATPTDPVQNVPDENGVRESVKEASHARRGRLPGQQGQDAAGAGRQDGRGPAAGAGELRLHHARREPDGVRHDRRGRDAGLRADRDLRRADARRPRRGSVRRARRRAADRRALPLQAGRDDPGPVRGRLRRRRRVRQEGQVRGAGDDQEARRHAHRRDGPDRRLHREAPTRSRASATRRPRSTPRRSRAPRATSPRSTRAIPPSDMHEVDFADVVGKKPVALLFSTPQLCQSRVCGPVTDMELQMKSKYGDKMTFIHQEVWRRQRHQQGPARAAAGSSTCRPSPGCSWSTPRA